MTAGQHDLGERFARLIRHAGPMPIALYMAEANAQYYASRDPLGASGDFITAPEISQMFGELIGLWLADLWQRAGIPGKCHYAELGPGRGTLTRDALRAAARFGFAPQAHLVEASPALRAAQAALIPEAKWHDSLDTLPEDAPLLIVANEFFDALPVRQWVKTPHGWRERVVGLDGERFVPMAGERPLDMPLPAAFDTADEGAILESCPAAAAVVDGIARRLAAQGGAALIIDYGYAEAAPGSSLQAVRAHQKVNPFDNPGEADLTALVDFGALRAAAQAAGALVDGPIGQGAFLNALGIGARAQALGRANPGEAARLTGEMERLTAPDQMGELFKALALRAPDWPAPVGFAPSA